MKAKKQYEFQPDYAVCPGETLQEIMESFNMSQKELAVRAGLTVQSLNRIFKGEQPITYESANRLELATGVPARYWNNLETQYREHLAKVEERKGMESDLQWLKTIPTKELAQRGFIKNQILRWHCCARPLVFTVSAASMHGRKYGTFLPWRPVVLRALNHSQAPPLRGFVKASCKRIK